MNAERVKEIVADSLLLDPADRPAFVADAAGGDVALHDRVLVLIDLDEPAASLFRTTVPDRLRADATPSLPSLDGYEIVRLLGIGGMGAVYEAVQQQPRRTVALKLLHAAALAPGTLRRFGHEAEVLARLRHPNIAQVYEVGMRVVGAVQMPYFALELVSDARPVTDYAAQEKLGVRDRIELFIKICEAAHHGHQRGVIHRDLKPANILVDAAGEPKIIDFGVARATDADLTLATMQTHSGQLIGTLAYMSPEQCAANPDEIDTRSDVYALGVVLYELLCGRAPYEVREKTLPEALRIIQLRPPSKPSTVHGELRGDLETIVLKTLEKDRDRRYQAACDLARDLRRYLNHEPIDARPPSFRYQARLFTRRHRWFVAGLAAVAMVLVTATLISAGFAVSAARQRDEATRAANRARRVTETLASVIILAEPKTGGPHVPKAGLLDLVAEALDTQLADLEDDEVVARLRYVLGDTYYAMNRFDEAKHQLAASVAIRRRLAGITDPSSVSATMFLVDLLLDNGDFEEAATLLNEMLGVMTSDHDQRAWVLDGLGRLHWYRGDADGALRLLDESVELKRSLQGDRHESTATGLLNLADAYADVGRLSEGIAALREALAIRRHLYGESNALVAQTMGFLAGFLTRRAGPEDLVEAEALLRGSLEILPGVVDEDNIDIPWAKGRLAGTLAKRGRDAEAEALFREALAAKRRLLGDEHMEVANSLVAFALFLRDRDRPAEAETLLGEALAVRRRLQGDDHRYTVEVMKLLEDVAVDSVDASGPPPTD